VQASRFCPASPPPPPPKANGKNRAFIIRVGYLMTMDQKLGDIVDADVLVKDGKIAKVGKNLEANGGERFDGRNMNSGGNAGMAPHARACDDRRSEGAYPRRRDRLAHAGQERRHHHGVHRSPQHHAADRLAMWSTQPDNIDTVVVAGQVVKRGGSLRVADTRHAVQEAASSMKYLLSRSGQA
jgi:hypothetical protein